MDMLNEPQKIMATYHIWDKVSRRRPSVPARFSETLPLYSFDWIGLD